MSVSESLNRMLVEMTPLVPGLLTCVVATAVALAVLYFRGRNAWVDQGRFSMASLFFGLDGWGTVSISCAWLKLIFLIVYLVSFQKLVLIQYLMILIPGLVMMVCTRTWGKAMSSLLWLVMELAGLVCASLVCGYIREMAAGIGFVLVYVAIALFLALFGIYLFLTDLGNISQERSVDPKKIWRKSEHDDG